MIIKKLALFAGITLSLNSNIVLADELDDLATYAKVSKYSIQEALSQAVLQQKIIDSMNRPSEAKPWWQYRKIFITTSRINAGVKFYFDNQETLTKAEKEYGVPYEIICAIIGVETLYGKNMGNYRVLDALYTLGFNYPPREKYFKKEFARFVALKERENWNYSEIKGSYAGAMGMGQFMPSSYLDYAVDYDNDGHINLFTNTKDAIGSVANYFKGYGYLENKGIFYPCHINKANAQELIAKGANLTVKDLYDAGVTTKVALSKDQQARLFEFDLEDGTKSYCIGLNNFLTIMKYNTSKHYARAVYELATFIHQGVNKIKANKGLKTAPRSYAP